MIVELTVQTKRQGLLEITDLVQRVLSDSNIAEGLCTIMIRHTSASLIIQENADPSARHDLEQWINQLVKEGDTLYTHTSEGPDDMPAHIKSALTNASIAIPFDRHRLMLGTWQGIYLWEHRHQGSNRRVVVHVGS